MMEMNVDNRHRMWEIESDFNVGVKRPPEDLIWYAEQKKTELIQKSRHWRHKESDTVYSLDGIGLAATGKGVLAPMVHYVPYNKTGPKFERQLVFFLEKFEPVYPSTVWERCL